MANHFVDRLLATGRDSRPFLRTQDGASLTYGAMRHRIEKVAAALTLLGVVPGDRIAAQIEKSTEGLLLYIGAVRAGAIFLPLNTAYTTPEVAYFLRDADPKVIVCDPAHHDAITGLALGGEVRSIETLDAQGAGSLRNLVDEAPAGAAPAARNADDLAAILYTSGTTGRSKGAMLTHDNLVSNAETLAACWRFSEADVLLHALPIYHTHGLFVATNTVLASGASMLFLPKFDADTAMSAMPSATVMMGVPTYYTRLLGRPDLTREATAHMRLFVCGSAPLLAETHRSWSARTGHAILERYGMTETNMNTSNPYDGERRPGTVGFPLPGVELRIVDAGNGAALGTDQIGMIEVRGPNVCSGYWRYEEKTAEAFRRDDFFVTGDLGKRDADGYVHIVGREKDLVICGGLNVYAKEVETEIDELPGVLESAIIGVPHDDLGECVVAVVVRESTAAIDENMIKTALDDRLAGFKQPKRVFFVDELPRNAMGKVQKARLRATFMNTFAS